MGLTMVLLVVAAVAATALLRLEEEAFGELLLYKFLGS
jgi:hypothetical protein